MLAAMELPVQTTSSPEEVLLARLRGGPTLLVLDNCEHECERTAAFVGWVTSHDTGVGILATSRVPLSVHGEQLVQLGPLPTDGDDCDSIRLFTPQMSRGDAQALSDCILGLALDIALPENAICPISFGLLGKGSECLNGSAEDAVERMAA